MATGRPGEAVTFVVHHRVQAADASRYEAWLQRIVAKARAFPGHRGVSVIRPEQRSGDVTFTSVLHFADEESLGHWIDSAERRQLIDEIAPLLRSGDQIEVAPGAEFWFTPGDPGVSQPPRWKQALLTFCIIYPLTLILPLLWRPAFIHWPLLGGFVLSNLLITLCIVMLVVYLLMPWATRRFDTWLTR